MLEGVAGEITNWGLVLVCQLGKEQKILLEQDLVQERDGRLVQEQEWGWRWGVGLGLGLQLKWGSTRVEGGVQEQECIQVQGLEQG